MIPQYRLFYSWQSDNSKARNSLKKALDAVLKQLKGEGVSIELVQGGGGDQFVSIEDAVRLRIRRCDIFVGDVTPVGSVAMKGKLLPNANVMYELGIATESMTADRVLAVAMAGEWKPEDMPFDFRQYTMLFFKEDGEKRLKEAILNRINNVIKDTRREYNRFFSQRLLTKNIQTQKYMPNAFLEFREAKELARCFVAPLKMYRYLYEQVERLNFTMLNRRKRKDGTPFDFHLDVSPWNIQQKAVDLQMLQTRVEGLKKHLFEQWAVLDKDGNWGWRAGVKIKHLAEKVDVLDKQLMIVTSGAGQGKTNFVCDLAQNVLRPDGIPYVFVNAYELSADDIATSIAQEYNFIGDGSLENVLLKAELYCRQQLQYFIIVIDGLNEQPLMRPFKTNLLRVLNAVKEYSHVKVLMTCRKEFYHNNLLALKKTFADKLVELDMSIRKGRHELDEGDWDCLMERYASFFDVKGQLMPNVKSELERSESLLLLRIFYETYSGKNISTLVNLDYTALYESYYQMLCGKIQENIEEGSRIAVSHNVAHNTFTHIIEWMVACDTFRNIPALEIVNALPQEEQGCFSLFMNTNLILQYDYPENESGTEEVINFTFEELRDYLLSRFLIEGVFPTNPEKFIEFVEKYTKEDNNLAEGIKRYLFLYSKNNGKGEIFDMLHKFDWFEKTFIVYIFYVKDDVINQDDVNLVKGTINKHPNWIVKRLVYEHWNPETFKNLNIRTFFEVYEKMSPVEQNALLDKVWPDKIDGPYHPSIETPRKHMARLLQGAIEKREREGWNGVEELKKLQSYLIEPGKKVKALAQDADEKQYAIRGYDIYRYVMAVHKGERQEFINRAGVTSGFSNQMMGDIYDAIFAESQDVKYIYETYFSKEYEGLSQFVTMFYGLPMDTVKVFMNAIKDDNHRLIDFSSIDYGIDQVTDFVFGDEQFDRFYNWLNWQ